VRESESVDKALESAKTINRDNNLNACEIDLRALEVSDKTPKNKDITCSFIVEEKLKGRNKTTRK